MYLLYCCRPVWLSFSLPVRPDVQAALVALENTGFFLDVQFYFFVFYLYSLMLHVTLVSPRLTAASFFCPMHKVTNAPFRLNPFHLLPV